MGRSRAIEFPGPCGRLEAILQEGGTGPCRRGAVVCHPHPLGGGTLHTKVVHRTARALADSGHLVLRFNFRGVGASEGTHDRGIGEQDDARAALDHLEGLLPGAPITMAGFSFGSFVGLKVACGDPRVDALIGIALPVSLYDFGFLPQCHGAKLFLHGAADTLAPIRDFEAVYPAIAPPKEFVRLEGGSHLLTEHLDEVEAAIRAFSLALPRPAAS